MEEDEIEEKYQRNKVSAYKLSPNLLIDIGSGVHNRSQKPRKLFLKTEKNEFDQPIVKLIQNEDDVQHKLDANYVQVVLDMTMWARLCMNDSTYRSFANKKHAYTTENTFFCLGMDVYQFQKHNSNMLEIKRMHMPRRFRNTIEWNKKENCEKVYDLYLISTDIGVSLNSQEYASLRWFFQSDLMEKYIPDIKYISPECKYCYNTTLQRYRSCRFCNYFTFSFNLRS